MQGSPACIPAERPDNANPPWAGGGGSAGPAVLTCREASVSPLLEDWRDGRRPGGGVEAAEVLPRGPRC